MKKETMTKIIGSALVFFFVISIFQFTLPSKTFAATNTGIDWENPNKTGKAYDTYKFKVTDVINSQVAMQVVGCTGVVNKIASWAAKLLVSDKMKGAIDQARFKLAQKACDPILKVSKTGLGSIINMALDGVADVMIDCKKVQNMTLTPAALADQVAAQKAQKEKDSLEGCYNGIAITLAKNQLTAMTRSAMSWVNAGFGGDPMYVQNITSLTNSIERNIIEPGTSILLDSNNQYPYGRAFAQSLVKYNQSRSGGLLSGIGNTFDNLTSDLGSFITDPNSYFDSSSLTALQKSERANDVFANDFSTGGWDGWLALTQRDQNSPLGFTMLAAQRLADKLDQDVQKQKDEIMQNNGYLSQKRCIKWQWYDGPGKPKKVNTTLDGGLYTYVYNANKSKSGFDVCVDFEVTTPGTIIKDKVNSYLSSPERQLEIADTINQALNAVFSVLISKLQLDGLSGLSSEKFTYTDENANWISTDAFSSSGSYDNNGAYSSGFDLTRDLGNTYYHEPRENSGTWNAKTGVVTSGDTVNGTLSVGYIPPSRDDSGNIISSANDYYTTTTAGNAKLVDYGYNGWMVGDRAYWDGTSWQNWKKEQANPILKRGVIQIQSDYIVAAKEMLQFLPSIMPKLGELDYCLPGPNPSYQTNSADAQTAYLEWVGSITTSISGKNGTTNTYIIDEPGGQYFEKWKSIYSNTQDKNEKVWEYITTNGGTYQGGKGLSFWGITKWFVDPVSSLLGQWITGKGDGSESSTFYSGIWYFSWPTFLGNGDAEKNKDVARPAWIENYLNFTNNHLFQNFYSVFDSLMNKLYFKNVTSMYVENERTGALTANPAYIPMAEEGYGLTKNMLTYSQDINTATQEYVEYVALAKSNIGKLEGIRSEVTTIVKAAQKRRYDAIIEKLNEESIASGEAVLSKADFETKYASCLKEENVLYYDDSKIMTGVNTEENCTDSLDNDLDGLVDNKDPDCAGYITTPQ